MPVSPAVVGHLAHVLARVLPLGAADVQHALRPLVPGVNRCPVSPAPHRLDTLRFVITERAPTRAFSWLKVPTSN